MSTKPSVGLLKNLARRLLIVVSALGLTAMLFLVLPVIQAISGKREPPELYAISDLAEPPPPPPVAEEEPPEEEEEPEEDTPELEEAPRNLELDALTLALDTGAGSGFGGAGIAASLSSGVGGSEEEGSALFSLAELDQVPRAIYQPFPRITSEIEKVGGGTVYIIFVVDESGRVETPKVQRSEDPALERPALDAIKKWKFEPGQRNGEAVRFRMRVPITFPSF